MRGGILFTSKSTLIIFLLSGYVNFLSMHPAYCSNALTYFTAENDVLNYSAQNIILKMFCSNCSPQNDLLKMFSSKCSAQNFLLKLFCNILRRTRRTFWGEYFEENILDRTNSAGLFEQIILSRTFEFNFSRAQCSRSSNVDSHIMAPKYTKM